MAALGDEALIAELVTIVGRDNQNTCELLVFLGEVEERCLYADRGFDSMWRFCTESLGLCESNAGRKLAAARVCRKYPAAFALVASGKLTVMALALMRPHLNPENTAELFGVCSDRSLRKVEELLAARFPRPDVKDSVRRLPSKEAATSNTGSERLQPLSADRYGVHFTVDAEFRALLERVRDLASHRSPNGDLQTVLRHGLEAYERELMKQRFSVGKRPRAKHATATATAPPSPSTEPSAASVATRSAVPHPTSITHRAPVRRLRQNRNAFRSTKRLCRSSHSRYVAAAVNRGVYVRDGGQCTFVAEDGTHCRARRFLQLDHIHAHALGGPPNADNLRLRCRAHNLWHARRCYGALYVSAAASRSAA